MSIALSEYRDESEGFGFELCGSHCWCPNLISLPLLFQGTPARLPAVGTCISLPDLLSLATETHQPVR